MPFTRYRWLFKHLRAALKPAIAFEIWFTLILVVSFAPASAWLMNWLVASSGQFAVSDKDLLAFFLSPRGILFLLLTVGFILALWFAEQAALLIIALKAADGRNVSVSRVIWEETWRLPALFRLGLLQAAGYLAASIPFGFGIALTYWLLLGKWDLYFYLNVQPLSWWIAVAIAGALLTGYFLIAAWLYVRWLFSIPALVLENVTPTKALRKSWQDTRGRFLELGFPLAVCWLAVFVSSWVMTWLIGAVAAQILTDTSALRVLVPMVLGTLALIAAVDLTLFISGKIAHVMFMAGSYLETVQVERLPTEPVQAWRGISPRGLKTAGWLLASIILVMELAVGIAFLEDLNLKRSIAITAHRGSKVRAPENTLSAVQRAIAEEADFAEIDVQTTADGVVVLLHDADLMRVASVRRRLRDVSFGELKDIDVGSWFGPEFSSERIPTLQEIIDTARGRIKLNIELKFTWPDPALAEKVGHIIQHNGFASDCVVSSLNFQALVEIRRAFPELKTGFIVLQAVGDLPRMEADFFSINAARATPRLVRNAHGRARQVHVWTVNDLNHALSMIEMGVDNIITDEPMDIRRLLEEWNGLSSVEKTALMLRNLIVGLEPPQPGEL